MYHVVRKLFDESAQYDGEGAPRLTVTLVYDKIKHSNSDLSRRSKKLLEDSIERVISSIEEDMRVSEEDDMGSIDGEFDGIELSESRAANDMNRSIVDRWARPLPATESQVDSKSGGKTQLGPPRAKQRSKNGERPSKKRKIEPEVDYSPPTHVSFEDVGGIDAIIEELEDMIVLPLHQPKLYTTNNFQPTRGILFYGPAGCGKTMIANAIAAETGVPFISISAPSIVSGMSGESEASLREHFEQAFKLAPAILFIDEIDAIAPKRENTQREMEKRIVAQLLTCFDDLSLHKTGKAVIVIAATNRVDSLDPALRRGGRFDKEINLSIPNEMAREQILRVLTRQTSAAEDIDFKQIAFRTAGFVGADLGNLVSTASSIAIRQYRDTLKTAAQDMEVDSVKPISSQVRDYRRLVKLVSNPNANFSDMTILLRMEHFKLALSKVQPSLKREGFTTVPDTTWADIGALADVRKQLTRVIVEQIRDPEGSSRFGIKAKSGVLVYGPPGCGKTLLAKAVANESNASFINVNGPELLNKYVGESERAIRTVFSRARSSTPCVIFMDEIDAIVPKRDDSSSEAKAGVINTLLIELDGLGDRQGIYLIAATNRPDRIDPAIIRSGRLGTLLYVGLPGPDERVEILRTLTRNMPVKFDEGMASVAVDCTNFSGADLENLAQNAAYIAKDRGDHLTPGDFVEAAKVSKSSVRDIKRYEMLKARYT